MPWGNIQIKSHTNTAKILDKIKDQAFFYIAKNPQVEEFEVQKFIRRKFEENKLWIPKHSPIVAFGKNTAQVHYFLNSKNSQRIRLGDPILIDIWTRSRKSNSPFADITWMGFFGHEAPLDFRRIFKIVIASRDASLKKLQNCLKKKVLPTGAELDGVVRESIKKSGYEKNFPHSTGHSLGFISPHGKEGGIAPKNFNPLKFNLAYTIEPGVYIKNRFGVRSEINFYITPCYELVITTPPQKKIIAF